MTEVPQAAGEAEHLLLHTARQGEAVRTDLGDAQHWW
jgi:hypothetical protein